MITRVSLVILLIGSCSRDLRGQAVQPPYPSVSAGEGYTVEVAARFHRAMDLENWDDGGELSRFVYLHPSQFFPAAVVRRRGPVAELDYSPNPAVGAYEVTLGPDSTSTLDAFIAESPLDGFIVLHRGRIVYEVYPRMQPHNIHLLFSVTKAVVGTVVGVLEDRGEIDLRHGIEAYIPELDGTAWEGISVRDILEMASGMEQSEMEPGALTHPMHRHYQLEASLGWLPHVSDLPEPVRHGETYDLLRTLERDEEPGTRWRYTSSNTAVLGWLLERVTGKPLAEVLSEEVWSHIGAESDALMVVNENGIPVAHAGMAATLRDLARFGLLFTESWGVVSDERVISEEHTRRIQQHGRPGLFGSGPNRTRPEWHRHPAYQWDAVTDEGAFYKRGFAGQILAVFPQNDVVVAYFGTNDT